MPKFKVGDSFRYQNIRYTITAIKGDRYYFGKRWALIETVDFVTQ